MSQRARKLVRQGVCFVAAVAAVTLLGILAGCSGEPEPPAVSENPPRGEGAGPANFAAARLRVGVLPELASTAYVEAAKTGAEEAGRELGLGVNFSGPAANDTQRQVEMLESWIAQKYGAIIVAPNDPDAIVPSLEKARKAGIKVVTWGADTAPASRDFSVTPCTVDSTVHTIMDLLAEGAGPDAKYLIIIGSPAAADQTIWMEAAEKYRQEKYPGMTNLSETPKVSEDDPVLAEQLMTDGLQTYPDLNGVIVLSPAALPGAAEALRKAGAAEKVFLTGLAEPGDMTGYVGDGTVKKFVLWNAVDLGYLTVRVAAAAAKGELKPGAETFAAGRLGQVKVEGDIVIMGDPIVFDASTIAQAVSDSTGAA
jgi:ABC-type sugar transport system substrate-binding protein